MSGEMNTSLGNGLANLLSFSYVVLASGHSLNECNCIIEGDDGIFQVVKELELRASHFNKIGFDVKICEKPNLGQCGFCSTYFTEDGKCSIVEPTKVLTSLPTTFRLDPCLQDDLRHSKALSCATEYVGCPLLQSLGQRLLTEYPAGQLILDDWYDRQLMEGAWSHEPLEISNETRLLFWDTFGFSLHHQSAIEEHFRTCDAIDIFRPPHWEIPQSFTDYYNSHAMKFLPSYTHT